MTNLYTPHSARRLFPCWDDAETKAIFDVSIRHPTSFTVFFNRPISKTSFDEFGVHWTHFEESGLISTYNLAIMVIDDVTKAAERNSIHFMWHNPKANKGFTHAYDIVEKTMSYFTSNLLLYTSSILPKIDHVIVPNSPMKSMGARGLIVYR